MAFNSIKEAKFKMCGGQITNPFRLQLIKNINEDKLSNTFRFMLISNKRNIIYYLNIFI